MRTILAAILLAAAIVLGVAALVPIIVRPMVIDAVRAASPFGSQPLEIDVDVNVFGLLRGTIDRIHVTGADLEVGSANPDVGGARVGRIDVTATGVATSGQSFHAVAGGASTVTVTTIDGTTLAIRTVGLAGPSTDLRATATFDTSEGIKLIEGAFADAGVEVHGLELVEGGVSLVIFDQRVTVALGAEEGALVLLDPFGTGPFELITPTPDDPWRITAATVTATGIDIEATVDIDRVLAAR